MKRQFSTILFFLLSIGLISNSTADVWTTSTISSDTQWLKNNGTGDGVYIIDLTGDSLVVDTGATLTIEAGVSVKFHDDIMFFVEGTLNATGTVDDSILFTVDTAPGSAAEWGGIRLMSDSSSANKLIYCRIEYADADDQNHGAPEELNNGGAVFCGADISDLTEIKNCTIQNNNAFEAGAGLFIKGSPTVSGNLIKDNSAGQYAGGIGVRADTPFDPAQPAVYNNIIVNNSADGNGGGGVGLLGSAAAIFTNNLIYNNTSAQGTGGGIHIFGNTNFASSFKNSIIRGNTANNDDQFFGVPNITYSNIQGGYSGEGNIDADPQFNNPSALDFHVEANSAIVDAGTNSGAPAADFDLNSRPFDGDRNGVDVTDMGPYEYINTVPVITSVPDTTALEDEVYSYIVVVQDDDAEEELTFSLLAGPPFISIDAGTGEISGMPTTDEQAGDYTVTVQVSDLNLATDMQTYTLHVSAVNDAPVVSHIPDQSIDEGQSFSTINLDDFVEDEDHADSTMSWTYSGNLQLLVIIDDSRVATVTAPDTNWYGRETIVFTATDPGDLSGSDSAVFTINNVNDPPVVSDIPDQTIDEGGSFIQINFDNYVDDIDNVESDINWTNSGNTELIVTIDENRVATVEASNANWYGSETITFTATDPGGLSDSNAALFTVNSVNDAPVVSDLPGRTINEGGSFTSISLDDYVDDVDNADSVLSWTFSGNTELLVVINENRVATVSVPNEDWTGSESIVFVATDPGDLSGRDTVVFTVNNYNDAPVVSGIQDQTVDEGTMFAVIQLDNYVTDIDNNADEMTWTGFGNVELIITIDSLARTAVVTALDSNWFGSDSLVFMATDPGGLADTDTAVFNINPLNDAPLVMLIPDQTVHEDSLFADIVLDNYVNDADDPDDSLSWEYYGNNELLVSIDVNRVVTVTAPFSEWNGSESITFKVSDPAGLSDSATAVFTVDAVNDAPQFVAEPAQLSFYEDDSLQYPFSGWYANVDDADDPDSTLEFNIIPGKVLSVEKRSLDFVFKAPANWNGVDTLRLAVSDGSLADTASFTVYVHSMNDNPLISGLPQTLTFINDSSVVLLMKDYVYDIDEADSLLSWQFSVDNDSLFYEYDQVSTQLTLTAPGFSGEVQLICSVFDDSSASDSDTITVTVTPATAIDDIVANQLAKVFMLQQNYPNPFNPATKIKYSLPKSGKVKIEVYNLLGQKIATLTDEFKTAGVYEVLFNANNLPSGIYFYKIDAGEFHKVKRMILLR